MSHDQSRLEFHNVLKNHGITNGTDDYQRLINFLEDPANSQYLQLYYILCTGYLPAEEVTQRTVDLIKEMRFICSGNYSYRHLFHIHPDWYQYFKENAYPCGQRRIHCDLRRGVDKDRVDRIMKIQGGPPETDLETAIVKECQNTYGT